MCIHTNTHTHSTVHYFKYTYLQIHYLNYFTIYQNEERQLEKQIKTDENELNLKCYKTIKNLEKKVISLKYEN